MAQSTIAEMTAQGDEGSMQGRVALGPEGRPLVSSVRRDLSRATGLQRYMAEVVCHPLLTPAQEHDAAVAFAETRDPRLAELLVNANLRLVVKLAHQHLRGPFLVLDLIQEGNIGLLLAVQRYDPRRGTKLSTYASWWIRAYILAYVMRDLRMVKIGTTAQQRKLFFNLRKEQRQLVALGQEPLPERIADRLHVSEQDVEQMDQRLGAHEVSLDTPLRRDGDQTFADGIAQTGDDVEDRLGEAELRRMFRVQLAGFGDTLVGERDRFLFAHRFAVGVPSPLTLQEVGAEFGLTRERARQMESAMNDRLRHYVQAHVPDFAALAMDAQAGEW